MVTLISYTSAGSADMAYWPVSLESEEWTWLVAIWVM